MNTIIKQDKRSPKAYKGIGMEGPIATWYAKIRRNDAERAVWVKRISETAPEGSRVLEIAPGPGYLAIELAQLGRYEVVGLDISRTFVEIAQTKAREAGLAVAFRQGDAAHMPFDNATFDFMICRAAFKNFADPIGALNEMHRVLRPGGRSVIVDLRRDISDAAINEEVNRMGVGRLNAFMIKWTFKHMLTKRAYTSGELHAFVAQSRFDNYEIVEDGIGLEVRLVK
jgi:ubiquinone/menaquinone biosynthesis C-methylase UbiE